MTTRGGVLFCAVLDGVANADMKLVTGDEKHPEFTVKHVGTAKNKSGLEVEVFIDFEEKPTRNLLKTICPRGSIFELME